MIHSDLGGISFRWFPNPFIHTPPTPSAHPRESWDLNRSENIFYFCGLVSEISRFRSPIKLGMSG